MLTNEEIEIYQRQLMITGWDNEVQERLKKSTVFVAGAGGLGSPLLFYLTVAGIGTIIICDYDVIELSNLNRQILHPHTGIGMLKVDTAAGRLIDANRHANIIKIKEKITKENAEKMIGNPDIIIDCLDNFDTRHILNHVSVKTGIPMIHAGVAGFQGQLTFLHPPETPCLACFIPQQIKKEKSPIFGATAGIIGSLQASEAIKYLTGIGENLKNRLLIYDGLQMRFETIKLTRNEKCEVCGKMGI